MTDPETPRDETPRFTPGPWMVEGNDRFFVEVKVGGGRPEDEDCVVCASHDYDDPGGLGAPYPYGEWDEAVYNAEVMANARLIAAAPDLYAALVEVEEWLKNEFKESDPLLVQCRAALQKANGQ